MRTFFSCGITGLLPALAKTACACVRSCLLVLTPLGLTSPVASASDLHVAVATNFLHTLEGLEPLFEASTGHNLVISSGSSGSLYAQITNGAPYEVFLSADEERPALLAAQRPGSHLQPYATGRLALWWPNLDTNTPDWQTLLQQAEFRHIAIANPRLAPYGVAASQVLDALGLSQALAGKLVTGENIGQTYSLISSGNAEIGFVAWSQLAGAASPLPENTYALIPEDLHAPVLQTGIVVKASPAAEQFMDFLKSKAAQTLIIEDGYGIPAHD